MIAYVVQSGLSFLALFAVVVRFSQVHERQAKAWAQERSELLNRIQHPERMPLPAPRPPREPVELPQDDFHLVGSIDFSEPEE